MDQWANEKFNPHEDSPRTGQKDAALLEIASDNSQRTTKNDNEINAIPKTLRGSNVHCCLLKKIIVGKSLEDLVSSSLCHPDGQLRQEMK